MKKIEFLLMILSATASANATEPICAQAALIAGAAFKEASSLGYEQQDVKSFKVDITSNMTLERTAVKTTGTNKFLETYLVQQENGSRTDKVATVVIEAYNRDNGYCVIKSISQP